MFNAVYNIVVRSYYLGVSIASLFKNEKAKKWIAGQQYFKSVDKSKLAGSRVVWFHCASVGEFEQARPVIEGQKEIDPTVKILLTFFSPSGFELRKDYPFADCVTYLPLDTSKNARAFLNYFEPDVVVFIKYELWFNFIHEITERSIPMSLICAHFPSNHVIFNPLFKELLNRLKALSSIQVQNIETKNRLEQEGLSNVQLAGDTRYDRVMDVARLPFEDKSLESFVGQDQVLVIGSFWMSDFKMLFEGIKGIPNLKVIVVPHELSANNQAVWKNQFGSKISIWSQRNDEEMALKKVLYVDLVGLLSRLYRFATIAYVGGGFESAVHNTLEPTVYGVPVVFGPLNKRFEEVQQLKKIGGGFEIHNQSEFSKTLKMLLSDEERRSAIHLDLQEHFETNVGATNTALSWVQKCL